MPTNEKGFTGKVAFVTGAAKRHRPRGGAGVRPRGGQRGGRRRVRAGQPGDGPPDRGARRAGARRPVRRDAGRGREGGPGQDR